MIGLLSRQIKRAEHEVIEREESCKPSPIVRNVTRFDEGENRAHVLFLIYAISTSSFPSYLNFG